MNVGDSLGSGMKVGDVPCNGCVRCCVGDAVRILPVDDATQYEVVPHDTRPGELMLDHTLDGNCIYLDEDIGCTIHNRKPQMCRELDCRLLARRFNYTQARKMKNFPMPVWLRGRELLQLAEDGDEVS